MAIKDDAFFLTVGVVLLVGASWYAKNKITAAIPQVVKDGAQAAGQMAMLAGNMVVSPLDTFGVSPGNNIYGTPNYQITAPVIDTTNPMVSDTGMDYSQVSG